MDTIILAFFIGFAVYSILAMSSQTGSRAVIYEGSAKIAEVNISGKFAEKDIPTSAGTFKIKYGDNGIRVLSSPCLHKICVKQKDIHYTNQQIICMPSRMIIKIESSSEAENPEKIDGLAR